MKPNPSDFISVFLRQDSHRYRNVVVSLFFLVILLIGLHIFSDYGISWDEPVSRNNGMITLKYLGEHFAPKLVAQDKAFEQYQTPLSEYRDRDYGVAFETPVSLIERLLRLTDTRDIYLLRHQLTFMLCFSGLFAVFQLAERRFSDWRLGLASVLILVLSPRLFAESFYNDKDAVFMALFAIATNTVVRFLLQPTLRTALWCAAATAIAIDVRIMAIILPIIMLAIFILRLTRRELSCQATLPLLSTYLILGALLVVALWPYLWPAPWQNFVQALKNMSKFRWNADVRYLGRSVPASELPWHYLPVWIAISTPLPYVLLFLIGAGRTLRQLVYRKGSLWYGDAELQDLLFLGLFACPLVTVIALRSVVYDGWRQMYFIYPAFVLIALRGWIVLWGWHPIRFREVWKRGVIVCSLLYLIGIGLWMIKIHPFQNVYFNRLAGHNLKNTFEVDYWGLSSRQALQYILKHDHRPTIKICANTILPLNSAKLIFDSTDQKRILIVDAPAKADYIVTNYRFDSTDYNTTRDCLPLFKHIRVAGEIIFSIFKEYRVTCVFDGNISAAQAKQIALSINKTIHNKNIEAHITAHNNSNTYFKTISATGRDVRLSWRFVPLSKMGERLTEPDWNTRKNLFLSIPPGESRGIDIDVHAPSPLAPGEYLLEVSLVQEGVAWLHDLGMPVASTPISITDI